MKKIIFTGFTLLALSYSATASAQNSCDWTGTWTTNGGGDMRLVQAGTNVVGEWGEKGTLTGKTGTNCSLTGQIDNRMGPNENAVRLHGKMDFTKSGETFSGTWQTNYSVNPRNWSGNRASTARPILQYSDYPKADIVAPTHSMATSNMSSMGTLSTQTVTANSAQQVAAPLQAETPQLDEPPVQAETTSQAAVNASTSMSSTPNTLGQVHAVKKQTSLVTPKQTGLTEQQRQIRQDAKARTTANREAYLKREARKIRGERIARMRRLRDKGKKQQEANRAQRQALKTGKWEVNLEYICTATAANGTINTDLILPDLDVFGIAWIKARIINKNTGRQEDVAPIGGFPRVDGDKERAWSVGPNEQNFSSAECNPLYTSFTYEFDATKYGYTNLDALIKEPRNRIDVMFKLEEYDRFSKNDQLGTRRVATSLATSDFCGDCRDGANGPMRKAGNGVLTGFRDGKTKVRVYYSIRPVGFDIEY